MSNEFAKRVIRIKNKLSTPNVNTYNEEPEDPSLLAASNVSLLARRVDAFPIGKPRASQIRVGCIRFHVIGSTKKLQKKEWDTVKGRIVFGMGNALHYWVQNTSDIFEDDRRAGWWKCLACGKLIHFGKRPLKACKHCGAHPAAAEYHEHMLSLEGDYPIGGHPDLFLLFKGGRLRVVEIKSINGADFLKLKAPLVDHEWQIQTYMWGCSIDPAFPAEIDPSMGYVLYISKKAHKEFPLKMFPVRKSLPIIDMVKERAQAYRIGMDNYPKDLPEPHPECVRGNFGNYRAKQCACRKECLRYG